MTKKELRKILKAWLDENQIAFDPSLNTPNLLRFAERNGFVSSEAPEGFEENEETETQEQTETEENGTEETEETGTENFDDEGNENPDETGNEETEEIPESVEEVIPPKRTVKTQPSKTVEKIPQPSKTVEKIPQPVEEKKTDNTWLYALLALAVAALVIYFKNRNNG